MEQKDKEKDTQSLLTAYAEEMRTDLEKEASLPELTEAENTGEKKAQLPQRSPRNRRLDILIIGLLLCSLLILTVGMHLLEQKKIAEQNGYQVVLYTSPAVPDGEATQTTGDKEKINLNTADAEALTKLPGIGEKIAEDIINYRLEYGDFTAPEELMNVPGIGEKKYAAIKDSICI